MEKKYDHKAIMDFYKDIRAEWNRTKELYDTDLTMQEAYRIASKQIENLSPHSFAYVAYQMKSLSLMGYPVIDCKTFQGWKNEGYIVRKGQSSILRGVTWRSYKKEETKGEEKKEVEYMSPKVYKLFHRSQVDKIEGK